MGGRTRFAVERTACGPPVSQRGPGPNDVVGVHEIGQAVDGVALARQGSVDITRSPPVNEKSTVVVPRVL